jgi:hypothetical protein
MSIWIYEEEKKKKRRRRKRRGKKEEGRGSGRYLGESRMTER